MNTCIWKKSNEHLYLEKVIASQVQMTTTSFKKYKLQKYKLPQTLLKSMVKYYIINTYIKLLQ